MNSATLDQASFEVRFRYSFWDRVRSGLVMSLQTLPGALVFLVFPLAVLALLLLQLYRGVPIDAVDAVWMTMGLLFPLLLQVCAVIAVHFFGVHKGRTYQYSFGDFGLCAFSDTEEWTQSWKAITQVKQQGGFLLLFFSRGRAHCLPYRQVQQQGALEPILSLARAHGVRIRGA